MNRKLVAGIIAALGASALNAQPKKLLMHYMPWYQTPEFSGFWGIHWAGPNNEFNPDVIAADGRPDIYSHYDPLIGLYDSKDPDAIECHLLQMKLAGVDGVLMDWYGLSDMFDYPPIHEATEAMFAATADFGMEFAIVYEDRSIESQVNTGQLTPALIPSYFIGEFAWMQANWFSQPHYVRKDGRPLLLNFGPIYVTDPAAWNTGFNALPVRPYFYPLHNLWTIVNGDGGFTWFHWSAWEGNPSEAIIKQRLNAIHSGVSADPDKVIPSAVPGFKDIYEPGGRFPFLDHNNGETMRQSLEVALDGPWPIVQLATWNDYGEGTMIEPTYEFGYTFLEVIQQERREEIGASFVFTPADLRLPARLFAARKADTVPDATLDTVSSLLNAGDTAQARALLDLLDGSFEIAAPESVVVEPGDVLVLAADVPGDGAGLTLRWFRDGVPLADDARTAGSGTPTLSITGAVPDDVGAYELVATVGSAEARSGVVLVGVRASSAGPADFNGDGAVDSEDVQDLLEALE